VWGLDFILLIELPLRGGEKTKKNVKFGQISGKVGSSTSRHFQKKSDRKG